jgi:uncharacterized protein YaiL (DUF2058 family)
MRTALLLCGASRTARMQNLRDKLKKAGLISAEQAAEAEKAAPRREPPAAPSQKPARPERTAATGPLIAVRREPLLASVPKLPPLPGSREAQRLESRKQLEQDRALGERVASSEVPLVPGERAFYFVTRKNRLRRLELSTEQALALESGALAVAERPEPGQIAHALIPRDAAEALLRDLPRAVRFFNRPGEPVGFLYEEELRTRQEAEVDEAPGNEETAAEANSADAAPSV